MNTDKRYSCRRQIVGEKLLLMLVLLLHGTLGFPGDQADEEYFDINIPSMNAADGLNRLASQTGATLLFPYDLAKSRQANAVSGYFTLQEAMEKLLRGSGLSGGLSKNGVIKISLERETERIDIDKGKATMITEQKNTNKKVSIIAGLTAFLASIMATSNVVGEETNIEANAGSGVIEEIIVTATRRETSLNDTPLSITAFSSEDISRKNLSEMNDYLRTVPGVNLVDLGISRNAVVVRGIGVDPQREGEVSSPTTGVYFGDVPLTGLGILGGNADLKMIDLERVEVLRGPQGTLFGSGSLAGTVRNIPKAPNLQEVEGSMLIGYSNTAKFGSGNTKIEGVVNVPIIEDVLAVRAVAYHHDTSGYIKNIAGTQLARGGSINPGVDAAGIQAAVIDIGAANLYQDRDNVGNATYIGGRVSVLWKPIDNLDITLHYVAQDVEQEGHPFVQQNTGGYTQVVQEYGPTIPADGDGLKDDISIVNLSAEYDFGWAKLLSSSSRLTEDGEYDNENSSFVGGFPLAQVITSEVDVFSEELRLVSQLDGPFQYVFGLYYEDVQLDTFNANWASIDATALAFTGSTEHFFGPFTIDRGTKQIAFYGELSYQINEQFELTFGARRFDYEKEEHRISNNIFAVFDEIVKFDETGTNFKANLSFTPNDDMLFYAQWAEGFRLGNTSPAISRLTCDVDNNGIFDGTNLPIVESFDSDTVENYELGTKLSLLDNRLQINTAVYQVDWKGIPLAVFAGTPTCFDSMIINAGKARSQGFEIETQFQMARNFSVNLGGSYTNSELTEDTPPLGAVDGDRLPSSPEYNINVGLQYNFELVGYPSYVRGDYAYVDSFYNRVGETGDKAGGYGQLNMSAGITFNDFNIMMFAQNLTNNDALTYVDTLLPDTRAYRLRPRTVGINVGYRF